MRVLGSGTRENWPLRSLEIATPGKPILHGVCEGEGGESEYHLR